MQDVHVLANLLTQGLSKKIFVTGMLGTSPNTTLRLCGTYHTVESTILAIVYGISYSAYSEKFLISNYSMRIRQVNGAYCINQTFFGKWDEGAPGRLVIQHYHLFPIHQFIFLVRLPDLNLSEGF